MAVSHIKIFIINTFEPGIKKGMFEFVKWALIRNYTAWHSEF